MRLLASILLFVVAIAPVAAADDEPTGPCQGHEGDPTPLHHGVDEGGEYIAVNQDYDSCTGVWYNPGEKHYIGPVPCLDLSCIKP